jgi:hypothetical protein
MPSFVFNPGDGIFIADIFGFILALPIALFLSFWMSAARNKMAVILGSLVGAVIGFLVINGVAATIAKTAPSLVQPAAVFFGSLIFCATMAISAGAITDLLVGRTRSRDYNPTNLAHE